MEHLSKNESNEPQQFEALRKQNADAEILKYSLGLASRVLML